MLFGQSYKSLAVFAAIAVIVCLIVFKTSSIVSATGVASADKLKTFI